MAGRPFQAYRRGGRRLAPFVLLVGSFLCLVSWGFAFSPAGVPLLVIGTGTVITAMLLRPTVRFIVAGLVIAFLAWGGPIWVAHALWGA